jgi:lipoprotein-anchoring transpeptidase ErfK/SrfK
LLIKINIAQQKLYLIDKNQKIIFTAKISTALNGTGELNGSNCTPLGKFKIKLKIGNNYPINTIFISRRPTGEVYTQKLGEKYPQRDWILTRILWLTGLDINKNRYGKVDTLKRFIYIHGCPDKFQLGIPLSHGCIRMHNIDLLNLFAQVTNGTNVLID